MANSLEALPMPFLGQRFAALRDRLLTNPRFVSWASAFPLTRFVARKRAAALFDLCAGFVYSQVLFTCVTLGLFEMLRHGPLSSDLIAQRTGLPPEEALRLLQAARALKLVERRGESEFGLGELGAAVVANPGIAAMVEHHAHLYADLADPVALLRGEVSGTGLSRYWPYAGAERPGELGEHQVAAYSTLMALSLPLLAEEVLDTYPLKQHRCLLDVGGGEGVFVAAAAARAPRLSLMLFDLPAVAERAKARLSRQGLESRAEIFGGDFLSDGLPKGADVVSLVRVILDHDDETALRILKAAREALPSDGVLLLAEPLAEVPGAEATGAYFGLYLKAMGRGRPRNFGQIQALLTAAGFERVRLRHGRHVLRTAVVTARPQAEVLR